MASDYLLELDGIKGESQDDGHKETIEIASWSLGASNPTTIGSSGLSAGKVNFSDLTFQMSMEKASVALLARVISGKHVKKGTLWARKSGDDKRLDFMKIDVEDCVISSWSTSGSEGGGIPYLACSLAFSKITFTYNPQKSDETMDADMIATYDLKAQKK